MLVNKEKMESESSLPATAAGVSETKETLRNTSGGKPKRSRKSHKQKLESRQVRDRLRRQQQSSEQREQALESRRVRRHQQSREQLEQALESRRVRRQQQSREQLEQALESRRVSDRIRRQQESQEQCQQQLQTRRESSRLARQQESTVQRQLRLETRRTRDKTVDKFIADLKTTLESCQVCHCLVCADKIKHISGTLVTEACPTDFEEPLHADIVVCSKCNTQVVKGQWPSWAATNDLAPDDIPTQLAVLTPDEVRTISLICPFLKVIILPGGQFGEEGSVIHFPFPVQQVMCQLPRPLIDSELILSAVGVTQRETFQTLLQQLDHLRIYQALLWLRANNPLYATIPQTMPSNHPVNDDTVVSGAHEPPKAAKERVTREYP